MALALPRLRDGDGGAGARCRTSYRLVENDTDDFGDQVVVDENDVIVRFENRLLLNSARISVSRRGFRGPVPMVASSSHVHTDSPTFGIVTQLGYVSQEIPFDAFEVTNGRRLGAVLPSILPKDLPSLARMPAISRT